MRYMSDDAVERDLNVFKYRFLRSATEGRQKKGLLRRQRNLLEALLLTTDRHLCENYIHLTHKGSSIYGSLDGKANCRNISKVMFWF